MDLPEKPIAAKRNILQFEGMGEPGPLRARALLPGTPRCFLSKSATVFQWLPADCDVSDRRIRYQNDYGLAEASRRIASLLYIRRNAPRLRGCYHGTAGGRRLRTTVQSDTSGEGIPLAISPLRRARGIPYRWMP